MPSEVLVVLPTLGDRLDSLEEALESVDRQRAGVELRLVVVVPSRAAEAVSLARRYGAVIVEDPARGLAGAMNAGLAARESEEFYVGLGDDDLLRDGGVVRLIQRYREVPGATAAYGACDYIDGRSRVIGTNRAGNLAARILSWGPNLVPHPGALISLDALHSIGGFAEDLPFSMDLDAFLKLKKLGKLVSVNETVSAFRWHADSITVSGRKKSAREARNVKHSHMSRYARPVSLLWLLPVEWATVFAGNVVARRARNLAGRSAEAA